MASVTDCFECGEPNAVLCYEQEADEGVWNARYLCEACIELKEAAGQQMDCRNRDRR